VWPFKRREDRSLTLEQLLGEERVPSPSGVTVTADAALKLSAVFGCVRLLSDVVSCLPLHAFREGSREPLDPPPAFLQRPAAGLDIGEWVQAMMWSLLTRGNGIGLIVARAGAAQRPVQIEPVARDRVSVTTDSERRVVWRLDGREIDRDDLFLVKAYSVPGEPLGLSPLGYAAETVGLGLAAQSYGAKFFRDDSTPAGLLTSEQALTRETAQQLHDLWKHTRGGKKGTAVLGHGTSFQAISVSPEESQFLETRQFTVRDVCRFFGCPPEMLADTAGGSLTYANVEQRNLDFLTYGVGPWLTRLERALNPLMPRGQYLKFNTGALLRTTLKERYEAHEIGLRAGFLTRAEARELEDRPPLEEEPARPQLGSVA
jgi:HK97 family phage portal protein